MNEFFSNEISISYKESDYLNQHNINYINMVDFSDLSLFLKKKMKLTGKKSFVVLKNGKKVVANDGKYFE